MTLTAKSVRANIGPRCGSSSVIERFLAKEEVGGLIPLCRSKKPSDLIGGFFVISIIQILSTPFQFRDAFYSRKVAAIVLDSPTKPFGTHDDDSQGQN